MASDHVRELWPELVALEEHLVKLTSGTYEVPFKAKEDKNRDDEDADRIHRLLLRKQRATGSLGLNE